jgi:hypothetical protein
MGYMINGEAADIPGPEDVGGVTFVPAAKVVEMLGGYVTWDNSSKTANIELGDKKVGVQEDNDTVTVDGGTATLSSRPSMGGGALWVPVDLFSDVLGCSVTADGNNVMVSNM